MWSGTEAPLTGRKYSGEPITTFSSPETTVALIYANLFDEDEEIIPRVWRPSELVEGCG
jgi:hypothetical protein